MQADDTNQTWVAADDHDELILYPKRANRSWRPKHVGLMYSPVCIEDEGTDARQHPMLTSYILWIILTSSQADMLLLWIFAFQVELSDDAIACLIFLSSAQKQTDMPVGVMRCAT